MSLYVCKGVVNIPPLPSNPHHQVLRGLDMTLEPGETLAVAGTSGSGKSTLGLLLGRYYRATEGTVTLDGVDVTQLDPRCTQPFPFLLSFSVSPLCLRTCKMLSR